MRFVIITITCLTCYLSHYQTSWLQWTITITNKLSKITDSDDDMWAGFNKWLLSDGELKKLHLNSNKHAKMINE